MMSDSNDAAESRARKPASNFHAHVNNYKTYLDRLKKGGSSGISNVFGPAAELLPAEREEEEEEEEEDETRETVPTASDDGTTDSTEPASQAKVINGELLVTSQTGAKLWDVRFDSEGVAEVNTSDGMLMIRTSLPDTFAIIGPPSAQRRAEIVSTVVVDPATGNIYYQSTDGTHAVALLNNGFRIDQLQNNDRTKFLVTPPLRSGQTSSKQIEVKNLQLDQETKLLSYDTLDDAQSIAVPFHNLK